MHRLSSLPGGDFTDEITLVEQPPAPVLLLSSAVTDITTLANCLDGCLLYTSDAADE